MKPYTYPCQPQLRGQVGFAALQLGADGAEVHEPVLEDGAGHFLQGLVHPPVQLNLVVKGAEDVGDGALGGEGWKGDPPIGERFYRNGLKDSAVR